MDVLVRICLSCIPLQKKPRCGGDLIMYLESSLWRLNVLWLWSRGFISFYDETDVIPNGLNDLRMELMNKRWLWLSF